MVHIFVWSVKSKSKQSHIQEKIQRNKKQPMKRRTKRWKESGKKEDRKKATEWVTIKRERQNRRTETRTNKQ